MKPIAIFGGAFDPVTVGHVGLVELLEHEGFDVVCMPCGDRHSFEKKMLPADQRIEMLRLAIGAREICRVEIDHGTFRAADTYPLLKAKYRPPHWIIGSDNANCMERWYEGERLKREIPFIVIAREGHPLAPAGRWCLEQPHRFINTGIEREVSSTLARNAIAQERWAEAEQYVPTRVLHLIRDRAWYKSHNGAGVSLLRSDFRASSDREP